MCNILLINQSQLQAASLDVIASLLKKNVLTIETLVCFTLSQTIISVTLSSIVSSYL